MFYCLAYSMQCMILNNLRTCKMITQDHYQNSLLLLSYLVINADGKLEKSEIEALKKICEFEDIDESLMTSFLEKVQLMPEKDVYQTGIDEISSCSDPEKIKIFSWLYKISESDGKVDAREVRFLLYAVRSAGIEFDQVMDYARMKPALT